MKILTKIINDNIINVSITDEISDIKSEFDYFSECWRKFYLDKTFFIFKIDTTYLSKPDIKYCYKLAMLIREFKNSDIQYLKYSIMVIPNTYIRYLLNLILRIQPPVATIYVTKNTMEADSILNYKLDNSVILETFILINNVCVIET
tara:strand:- start:3426 stop:3866 length:441 start_codon:yes stop_codon:yes gene_type:complete